MKMTDVKKKATVLGIKSGKMKKTDLVRSIQLKEGNAPCFQTGIVSCGQDDCCWRIDCDQ
ncbi:MAG: SAP domain-containing protein [Desulfobulbaceae bacterium]|uniref:SAP domain-containing protein n=1 Tax=Candidatus Desulfobia pelagia TaxID=2841692 RepID=A0A8J6NFJ0_9BACT|nr:SAP domain-containing protein [Candidatus Desulfobia pelagia]